MGRDVRGRLAGWSVAVVRPADQAEPVVTALAAEGATAVVVPLVRVVDVEHGELLAAIADLTTHDWVVATSPNGADRLAPVLEGCPAGVAAVGAATADRLPRVDLVPRVQRAEGLLAELPAPHRGGRAVVVQSADAHPTLVDGLRARGWLVVPIVSHRTVTVVPTADDRIRAASADALLLTAGSQARAWVEVLGPVAPPTVVAIGEQTARDAVAAGLKVDAVAADHSITGTVEALVKLAGR